MNKNLSRLLFFFIFFAIGIGVVLPQAHKSKHTKAENLEIDGVVEHIEWKTKNHALPLFRITKHDGSTRQLNDGELNLNQGEIKVGDSIVKKSGSRNCLINSIKTECVNEFTGFHEILSKLFTGGA